MKVQRYKKGIVFLALNVQVIQYSPCMSFYCFKIISLSFSIFPVSTSRGCTCKDLLNQSGYGNCLDDEYNMCYVEQPSSCSDLVDSGDLPGEKYSEEACLIKGNA